MKWQPSYIPFSFLNSIFMYIVQQIMATDPGNRIKLRKTYLHIFGLCLSHCNTDHCMVSLFSSICGRQSIFNTTLCVASILDNNLQLKVNKQAVPYIQSNMGVLTNYGADLKFQHAMLKP